MTEQAGVGDAGYGLGVARRRLRQRRAPRPLREQLRPQRALPQQRRRHVHRRDATRPASAAATQVGAGACFLDIDGDGDLGPVRGQLRRRSPTSNHVATTRHAAAPSYPGPAQLSRRQPTTLFRNNGDGTFTDVSAAVRHRAPSRDRAWAWSAPTTTTTATPTSSWATTCIGNFLFQNDGAGKFEEVGAGRGRRLQRRRRAARQHGRRLRRLRQRRPARLLHDRLSATRCADRSTGTWAARLFEDVTLQTGAAHGTFTHVNWGCGFVDFDNDGHRDLFVACGHLQDNIEQFDDTTLLRGPAPSSCGTPATASSSTCRTRAATACKSSSVGRGAAFDDLDNDGDIDVVILNSRRPPTILRNESAAGNHWLQVRLRGVKTNRDGVGARVKVVAGDLVQIDEVHSGRGYQSHCGSRLHFGLGSARPRRPHRGPLDRRRRRRLRERGRRPVAHDHGGQQQVG